MKKTIRVSLFLLIAVLWTIMLASAQKFPTPSYPSVAFSHETAQLLRTYRQLTALPTEGRTNFFRSSSAADKSDLAKIHLALQLAKRRGLNGDQERIIVDAISLASSDFFASNNDIQTKNPNASDAVHSLRRRALSAFSKNEALELFSDIGGAGVDGDLLKKYDDFSTLPLNKRKAVFRKLSSNDKSGLWRIHLALFFVRRPALSEWQKGIILAAMSLVVPKFFDVQFTDPAWTTKIREPLQSIEQQIVVAFSWDDAVKIFATLGDYAETAKRSPAASGSLLLNTGFEQQISFRPTTGWSHSQFAEQGMEIERSACDCSTQSDWCPFPSRCNGTACNVTPDGCGTFLRYPCNGASCQ